MTLEAGGLGLERHESHAARHNTADDWNNLGDTLGEALLREVDADEAQALLHDRVPRGLRKRLLGQLLLERGHRDRAREHCQRLGRAANAEHDAEEHR